MAAVYLDLTPRAAVRAYERPCLASKRIRHVFEWGDLDRKRTSTRRTRRAPRRNASSDHSFAARYLAGLNGSSRIQALQPGGVRSGVLGCDRRYAAVRRLKTPSVHERRKDRLVGCRCRASDQHKQKQRLHDVGQLFASPAWAFAMACSCVCNGSPAWMPAAAHACALASVAGPVGVGAGAGAGALPPIP
jgi:hypothetical protein